MLLEAFLFFVVGMVLFVIVAMTSGAVQYYREGVLWNNVKFILNTMFNPFHKSTPTNK